MLSLTQNLSPLSSPPLQSQKQLQNPNSTLNFTKKSPSPASWIESLRSLTRSNQFQQALYTYNDMIMAGVVPNNFAFPAVLKAVTGLEDVRVGRQIQGSVVKLGYDSSSVTVANSLLNLYGKCGDAGDVYKVFDRMPERDQVSWNSMIAALCRFGEWVLALEFFRVMQVEGVEPSSFTLVSVALACSNLEKREGLVLGKQVHGFSLRVGGMKTFTNNALMKMYAKLGEVDGSRYMFELFEGRDMVSWNTMISALSQSDRFSEAMAYFKLMLHEGIKPDGVTIASILPACSHLELLDVGKRIHAFVLRNDDLVNNSYVGSALVDMYCNCRQVESGRRVFDGIVDRKLALWNAMLAGYAQKGFYKNALILFQEMMEFSGLFPCPTSMVSVLPSCVHYEAFSDREGMHGYVLKMGFGRDRYVQNALMDLYSRMGKIDISKKIFESMDVRDIVSWNTMITGYVVCGLHEAALILLHEMQHTEEENQKLDGYVERRLSCKPNSITLMTILPGCAALAALAKGKEIHAYAIRNALSSDVTVGSALVDMYAKCGCLSLARRVFDDMRVRNVITWNVMIMAYGMHGKGKQALELFNKMSLKGAVGEEVKPNEVTWIATGSGQASL
ncbi:hypothetical protein ACET3Z_024048 [Daucus carota]